MDIPELLDGIQVGQAITQGIFTGVGAFTAALSGIYLGNRALDRHRKPRLQVVRERPIIPAEITRFVRADDGILLDGMGRGYIVPYTVNRLGIRNNGKSAAKKCKGSLLIDRFFEKICWMVPSENYKMTINVNSEEFLDVCGIRNDSLERFIQVNGIDFAELPDIINTQPQIIVPTEDGWNGPRSITDGTTQVLVTGANCEPLTVDIEIRTQVINQVFVVVL